MRIVIAAALVAATLSASAADARRHYYYGRTHAQCRADKRRAGHQGIAVGAVAGGAAGALLGGGVGGALLGAGVGGVGGSVIGRGTEHCGDRTHAH